MTEIRCPQCNAPNRETARYCAECGALLQANAPTPDRETKLLENSRPAGDSPVDERPEAHLSHPNLLRAADHFTVSDAGQYQVADSVEGEDLSSRVKRTGRVASEQALIWGVQVCEALAYLHDQVPPVLHGDIRPANIRITPSGEALLVDFSLVKASGPQLKASPVERAVALGYTPPEQYERGITDVRSDIYALGATLYNLLTGLDPLESAQRALGQHILPIREISPEAPKELEAVIERAMELDPAERFQTSREMLEALQDCLQPPPASVSEAPPLTRTVQLPEPPAPDRQASIGRTGTMPVPSPQGNAGLQPEGSPPASRQSCWLWLGIISLALAGLLGLAFMGGLIFLQPTRPGKTPTVARGVGQVSLTSTPGKGTVKPTPLPAFRSKDPQTYVHLSYGEPDTLDPALDYETSGSEIIANLYDTLISYNRSDPNTFVPQLALEVPSVENGGIQDGGRVYRFRVRPGVQFHNGTLLTAEDVAYTFQRGILQGGESSSQWLFTEPLLGIGIYDVTYLIDPNLADQPAKLASVDKDRLRAACERVRQAVQVEGDEVVFRLAQPWSPFLATLATSFGSIVSKEWVIEGGGWDGDCATWQAYYGRTLSEINATPLGSSAMGTGPYRLESWKMGEKLVLKANENYWMKQPAWAGAPVGPPAIKTVEIRKIDDFAAALAQLRSGEADSIEVDSSTRWQDLDPLVGEVCSFNDQDCQASDNPKGPLELVRGNPSQNRDDILFNWLIDTEGENPFVGSGSLDGKGIPPDFFSNVHVRRGFAYCFNYAAYLKDYLHGEGVRMITVIPPGMVGYDPATPYYVYDPKRCETELRQAELAGGNVWQDGFHLVIPYETGNPQLEIIATLLRDALNNLNPRFQVEARPLESSDYYTQRAGHRLPLFLAGWAEDIHDPHNWVYPYAVGIYAHSQGMPQELSREFGDFVSRGVAAVDPGQRAVIYEGFNRLYYEQAPAILLYSTVNRHYQQRWVNGWYDNPINQGLYFYTLSKD